MSVRPRLLIAHRRFQFHKRSQFFIRTHNETLSVVAVRVSNPDRFVIRVCDSAGNVIATHEHAGDFKEW